MSKVKDTEVLYKRALKKLNYTNYLVNEGKRLYKFYNKDYIGTIAISKNHIRITTAIEYRNRLINHPTHNEIEVKEFLEYRKEDFIFQYPIFISKNNIITKFYIADFIIPRLNLIIEIDGLSHYTEGGVLRDKSRTTDLKKLGYNIIRIDNSYTNNRILLKQLIYKK